MPLNTRPEELQETEVTMIPDRVRRILDQAGLQVLEFEAGSTPTSEMAAQRIGVEVGQIAKSILLHGKDGRFRLAVLPGDARLSSSKFKKATGVKHRMATSEETLAQTGYRIGGVCPFDLASTPIFIEQGLAGYELVYPAAGTDASGVPMNFAQLVEITSGTVCDICVD
jgi:prolyl-tRNA editing enzyme YbaK/EbsC (Cys-tRNA(Pro) deacylase)